MPWKPQTPCRIPSCSNLVDRGQLCSVHRGKITVICGLPGSGKSTWVKKQSRCGDVVWDFDILFIALTGLSRSERPDECIPLVQAMRNGLILGLIDHSIERDVWIIVTREDDAKDIAERLNGKLICLTITEQVRQERLAKR